MSDSPGWISSSTNLPVWFASASHYPAVWYRWRTVISLDGRRWTPTLIYAYLRVSQLNITGRGIDVVDRNSVESARRSREHSVTKIAEWEMKAIREPKRHIFDPVNAELFAHLEKGPKIIEPQGDACEVIMQGLLIQFEEYWDKTLLNNKWRSLW